MKTYILHMDLDSFFVSVERIKDPSLNGKPVIVGGVNKRGVVSSCSYEARKMGVKSAMPGFKAKQLCPNGIFLPGDHGEYSLYSKKVTQIIAQHVPLFEKASIDEFYIDLTGMDKFYGSFDYAKKLREEIIEKTGLPISFGLGSNKVIAKMATNHAKPNGHKYIKHGEELQFLDPLPIEEIPSLGKQTTLFLKNRNIHTIKEIRSIGEETLKEWLGKNGSSIWNKANGRGSTTINPGRERKSISKETTYIEDQNNTVVLLDTLKSLTEDICYKLRKENKKARTLTIKYKTPDFVTTTRQTTIEPTNYELEVFPELKKLFYNTYNNKKIRLIGVKLSDFDHKEIQGNLFKQTNQKDEAIYKSLDELKSKFGSNGIKRASRL